MFKVSAVPPRRSAMLTLFRGATALNDGTTAASRRSGRSHCGLCRTSTAVAPRLRCDGASTAEARRNMFKVAAVPPRMSAVLTVFRGATTINDGATAEPLVGDPHPQKLNKKSWTWHGVLYFLFYFFLLVWPLRSPDWEVCFAGNIAKKTVAILVDAPHPSLFTENMMCGFFIQISSGWFRLSINATKIEETNVLTRSSW